MSGPKASRASNRPSKSTNVFDLLETLPRISLDRLYGQAGGKATPYPWTCRAVFQSLPPLAKHYVMRLLFLEGPVKRSLMQQWVEPGYVDAHNRALRKLDRLRMLLEVGNDPDLLELNPHFRTNFRASLTSNLAGPWSDPALVLKPDAYPPSALGLDSHMTARWNSVLHYLVGSTDAGCELPAEEVTRFLRETGLMAEGAVPEDEDEDGGHGMGRAGLHVTNRGISFLLADVHIQVWRFVEYTISHDEGSRDDILTFLFQLSYCRVGCSYPIEGLTGAQKMLLRKFESLGLIYYPPPPVSDRFYPTNVAVNLIFGAAAARHASQASELKAVDPNQLAIIIETNYQVIAYTSSTLHMEMLRIFADIRCRLPNAVIARITRDSVRRALNAGISAKTIVLFLTNHAHPSVRKRKEQLEKQGRVARSLPENVEEQIYLWHRERERMQYAEAMMIDLSRLAEDDFVAVRDYAQKLQVVLWATKLEASTQMPDGGTRKLLAVRPEGLDRVRTFIEDRRFTASR